jgi:hypothetical protein
MFRFELTYKTGDQSGPQAARGGVIELGTTTALPVPCAVVKATKNDLLSALLGEVARKLQDALAVALGDQPLTANQALARMWTGLASPEIVPIFRVYLEIVGLSAARRGFADGCCAGVTITAAGRRADRARRRAGSGRWLRICSPLCATGRIPATGAAGRDRRSEPRATPGRRGCVRDRRRVSCFRDRCGRAALKCDK